MSEQKRIAIAYSGGLDSTVMLYQAVKQVGPEHVLAVYVQFGQRNKSDELVSFHHFTKALGVQTTSLDLTEIFSNVSTEEVVGDKSTPNGTRKMYNRNMVIVSTVVAKAMSLGYNTMWLGVHASDANGGFVDCTPEFYSAAKQCVEIAYPWFTIEMPLVEKTKKEVIEWGIEAGMKKGDFATTWSCYRGWDGKTTYIVDGIAYKKPCTECETCRDRYDHGLKLVYPEIL